MICIAYFCQLSDLPHNFVPISISFDTPCWYDGETYAKLIPDSRIVSEYKSTFDKNKFIKAYIQQLNNIGILTVMRDLIDILPISHDGLSHTICLVCNNNAFEGLQMAIVAKWLGRNNFGGMVK